VHANASGGQVTLSETGDLPAAPAIHVGALVDILVWSADGRRLATLDRHLDLQIWDVASGKNIAKTRACEFSLSPFIEANPNGSLLAYPDPTKIRCSDCGPGMANPPPKCPR